MHCGLWFSSQGFVKHQRNCFLLERDGRVQEPGTGALEADSEVDSPPQSPDNVEWGSQSSTLTRDPDSSPGDSASDGTEPARTDGGTGLGLSGPPERSTPVDDPDLHGADGDAGAASCPACGDDLGAAPDEFREGKTYRCTDCGERWTGVP